MCMCVCVCVYVFVCELLLMSGLSYHVQPVPVTSAHPQLTSVISLWRVLDNHCRSIDRLT